MLGHRSHSHVPCLARWASLGQLAEGRLMCRAAGSCLSGWVPAAWVRGSSPSELKPGWPLGESRGLESCCRSWEGDMASPWLWPQVAMPGGVRGGGGGGSVCEAHTARGHPQREKCSPPKPDLKSMKNGSLGLVACSVFPGDGRFSTTVVSKRGAQ